MWKDSLINKHVTSLQSVPYIEALVSEERLELSQVFQLRLSSVTGFSVTTSHLGGHRLNNIWER